MWYFLLQEIGLFINIHSSTKSIWKKHFHFEILQILFCVLM
jgi:hypothetical protein